MSIVVENVKRCIADKGLKQKYIAERMNMSQQDFSNLLNGRKEFKIEYVAPVCRILGISANELFNEKSK